MLVSKQKSDRVWAAFIISSGTPGGTRTPNLMVRTHLLYPLSYRGTSFRTPLSCFAYWAKASTCGYGRPLKIPFSRVRSLDWNFGNTPTH